MTLITYPTIEIPSKIEQIDPTDFGVKVYEFDDGTTSRRLRHIQPAKTSIRFKYLGVDSGFVSTLMDFYKETSEGLKKSFDLPDQIFERHPEDFLYVIDAIQDNQKKWRFKSPPNIKTIVVDTYDVTVELENTPEIR